jgi:hypothetical protein
MWQNRLSDSRHRIVAIVILVAGILVTGVSGCGELAGSGKSMLIPEVRISCTASNCRSASGSFQAFVTITESPSCASAEFGQKAAGSGTVSCNPAGCTGAVTQFIDTQEQPATYIPEGTYSVCVILNLVGGYNGQAQSGDAEGSLTNAPLSASTRFADVSVFTNTP